MHHEGPGLERATASEIGADVVEVIAIFDETILCARHLRPGESFVIGTAPGADVTTAEGLPLARFPLVQPSGGGHELVFTAELEGALQRPGGATCTFPSVIEGLEALPCAEHAEVHRISLDGFARAWIRVGALGFHIRRTTAAPRLPRLAQLASSELGLVLSVLAILCMYALVLAFSVPPDPRLDRRPLAIDRQQLARWQVWLRLEQPRPVEKLSVCLPGEAGRGQAVQAAARIAPAVAARSAASELSSPAAAAPPVWSSARSAIRPLAAMLASVTGAAPSGQHTGCGSVSRGSSLSLAEQFAPIVSPPPDGGIPAFGGIGNSGSIGSIGGIGRIGDGFGRLDPVRGSLGSFGRFGSAGFRGTPCGGPPEPHAPRPPVAARPRPDASSTRATDAIQLQVLQVSGGAGRDPLRRIIARHLDEVGRCPHPPRPAQLSLRLVISASGVVLHATASGAPHDLALEQCVVDAARGWQFPPLDSGVTIVTAPITLGS